MSKITAFVGVIGSGKDHRTNILVKEGAVRLDFKDALLDMCSDIAGYDVREDYDWFKENIVGVKKPKAIFMQKFVEIDRRKMVNENPDLLTGRRLLQRLGTDTMRKRDPNYWINQWSNKARLLLREDKDIVCADCRFENEVIAINGYDSEIIFCDYRSDRYDGESKHLSEAMAQKFIKQGFKDGHVFNTSEIASMYLSLRR